MASTPKKCRNTSGTKAPENKGYPSKLDVICIYLLLFHVLTIVPKRGTFAAKSPLSS